MTTDTSSQQTPASCISCHVIGISAASILGIYMFTNAKRATSTTHRFTCALFGLEHLARILHSNIEQIQLNIQPFKCDGIIIEEYRNNTNLNRIFDPNKLFYKIDIIVLINVMKFRLIKLQSEIESIEREKFHSHMAYQCKQCLQNYTEFDIGKFYQNNFQEDFKCPKCHHTIEEYNPVDESCLFNQQMTPIFEILEKIDKIIINDNQTEMTMENNESKYVVQMDINEQETTSMKFLPEWFTRID